jgi:hypothetical protein
VDARALLSPPDPEYAEAWAVTERVLAKLHAEAGADGAKLVVATVSAQEQVDPDMARRSDEARKRGIQDLFYADKRLYALARREGFEMVPLARTMADIAARHGTYFHGFADQVLGGGHWNHNGHFVAGQVLADRLCRLAEGR